ncbi:MAG TPA: AAA family ATPase [Pseudonocardiaceae bacterium]|nr:AAA family ATPase [Pseudonocardiaceae bacterium]
MQPQSPLIGRGRESARLGELLSTTRAGRGAALVVRGEARIGKTFLVDHVAHAAVDHRVVRIRAAATEAGLPYSALHLLCLAMIDDLARLRPHHREALEAAVGLRADRVPDRLRLGVALVRLFGLAAADRPLLCVVDDMQWLDESSAQVLAFAARRLGGAPVALLLAGRGDRFGGLPDLVLAGLRHEDARALFGHALMVSMDRAVVERIVAEARGNPVALLESAARSHSADLAGGYGVAAPADVETPAPITVPVQARLLLVLAAAEPLGDPALLWRAAAHLGLPASAAEQLESDGLISFGQWVRFRDSSSRSFVYWAASAVERRQVHGALAAATDRRTDYDRYRWHLAKALVAPDDAVGDAVMYSARAAQDRGGRAALAAFLDLAASCATDPRKRTERAIRAAYAYHAIGATDAALRLLNSVEQGKVDAADQARLTRLRARARLDANRDRAAVTQLLSAAEDLERSEPRAARQAYLEALGAAIFTGRLDVVDEALARLSACPSSKRFDRLLDGVAVRWTHGYAAAVEPLKLALKTIDSDHQHDPRTRLLACLVAADLWDDDSWHELTGNLLRRARMAGTRAVLPYVLTHRALAEIHAGRFATAESLVNEATVTYKALGYQPFSRAAVLLAAYRGQEHPALSITGNPYRRDEGISVTTARYARAVLANGLGRYPEAVAATRHAIEHDDLELQGWALVELVEGAVRSDDLDTATAAFDRLSERTCLSGTDWALGLESRSRALLQDGDGAESLYRDAIERLSRTRGKVELARAQLVYGEWLRRRGRRVDARVPLVAAHRSFTEMGAEAFAGRANRELLATGERARRRAGEPPGLLTSQERRIAALAGDGRTNVDIGSMLSISPRTVEYHLHKVFAKLGISSRTELHLVLGETGESRTRGPEFDASLTPNGL